MLWPPTPRGSPQLHQATSRPGFHGAWWYRPRTTRVLRDPPPARGKRQGGDDGRTKTTPQHRGRNERGRGPSKTESPRTARTPRTPRVSHGHTRKPCLARRLECGAGARRSCLASPRGSRREERRAIQREDKKRRFTRIPQPYSAAAARAARPHDPYAPAPASRGRRLSRCELAWARYARSGEQREDATTQQSGGPAAGETDDND